MSIASKFTHFWPKKHSPASQEPWNANVLLEQRKDTESAIKQLLLATHSAPEVFAISLALGMLFRSQGELEKAIALREQILTKNVLNNADKAQTYYELGCDYTRAGLLDRALACFKQAKAFGFSHQQLTTEMANLYASTGSFLAAAKEYAILHRPLEEAHFITQYANECAKQQNYQDAHKYIAKALQVYPNSPEAWLALTSLQLHANNTAEVEKTLEKAIAHTKKQGKLILLEGLLHLAYNAVEPSRNEKTYSLLFTTMQQASTLQDFDLLECYYTGLFALRCNKLDAAQNWFTQALAINTEFWAARLALLQLAAQQHTLPALVQEQISFFASQSAHARRFTCTPCGLLCDTVFAQCPRCGTWHSMVFREKLQ